MYDSKKSFAPHTKANYGAKYCQNKSFIIILI